MKQTFSESELDILRELIGQKFLYLTGTSSLDLTAPVIYLVTDTCAVEINVQSEEQLFDGEYEEFAYLTIKRATLADVQIHLDEGLVNKKFMNERIKSVQLIHDEINGYFNNESNLIYASDSGVLIELENGRLAISKADHNLPLLIVSYPPEANVSEIPETESIFEEDLHQTFIFSRAIRPLEP